MPDHPDTPPDTPPNPPEQAKEDHRDAMVQSDQVRLEDQLKRHQDMRMDMMRSVVTEPLLSKIQAAQPGSRFDIIIALNELFEGGIGAALDFVKRRAEEWKVKY